MTTVVQQDTLFDNLVGPSQLEKNGLICRFRNNYNNKSFTNNPSLYASNRLCRRILDSVLRKNKTADFIGVFFTVEFAAELHKRGYKNVVVMTEKFCPETKKITEVMGYKYLLIEEVENKNMKFDVIVGNPPFNDDQNEKENNGNYVSTSKRLHLEFIDKALKLSDIVVMIAPVRRWWTGSTKTSNFKKYVNKGLYKVEDLGYPFVGSHTGEIGAFYFDKSKEFEEDQFPQNEPLTDNITTQYKWMGMVGDKTTGELSAILHSEGTYKVILTSKNIMYTNDNNLFDDPSRGNWRVAFNHNGNKKGKSIYAGPMQVVEPDAFLSKSMSCFITESEEEANELCEYLMSDEIIELIREIKISNTNSKYHFSFVPPIVC